MSENQWVTETEDSCKVHYYATSDANGVRLRGTRIFEQGYGSVFTGNFTPSGEQDRDRPFFLL